jgi:hypothetical protein
MAGSSVTELSMADGEKNAAGEAEVVPSRARFVAPVPARRRRWHVILLSFVVLILVAALVASRWTVNYYALTPGDATPVA